MKLTPQITFRNLEPSDAIEGNIQKHIAKLDTFYDRIMDCRVMIEVPHRHHRKGHLYHLRIDLTVPGGELVVNRDPPEHQMNEDVYVAIRDAFNSAERELSHYAERQRGDVKIHKAPPHGRISALFPEEGYGFIEATDGQEVYFHPNSLINADFSQLEVGQEVRFAAETGNQGMQASTVSVIGKHHLED